MKTNDLEARLDALESREAIDALIAGYAQAFDNQDETLLSSLWHEDSRQLLGDFGNSEGRDAILLSARRNWRRMPHIHHWMANTRITLNGDEATGAVAANCLLFDVEHGAIQVSGQYRDRYSRREGRWAFTQREFDLRFVTPLPGWTPVAGPERFGAPG
jgi:hypothetical protein